MTIPKHTVFLSLAAAILYLAGCSKDSDLLEQGTTIQQTENSFYPIRSDILLSRYATQVFEYTPAPGQYINETQIGGMTVDMTTPEEATNWALKRLENKLFVSLGAFGGFITVGFDHEVLSSHGDYDFAIFGNAFLGATGNGGSSEPGIVYVMEDTNSNGLPDDIWYELRGSDYYEESTIHDYEVTYYRPSAPGQPVEWKDNLGNTGTIDYLKAFHKQDYYFPAWIKADSYTLKGTRLADRTTTDPDSGFWGNNPFAWGYADNMGDDNTALDGMQQANRFRISDAVDEKGNPVNLNSITFVKVQTGVQSKASSLGEVSTEILGFYDLMSEPDDNAVPMIHI